MYNLFSKMVKMATKVVFLRREHRTFRQIERLGILVLTLRAHMLCLTKMAWKAQVFRIDKF